MIVLDILEFASSSIVNFLVTFLLLSLVAWGVANFSLVQVNLQYGDDKNEQLIENNKEEA